MFSSLKQNIYSIDVNYLVIILVALCQGITGLSDLALSYLYKDDLKLEPAQVIRISSIASIPWMLKPLYGFISDSFPIFGFRRKPYLFIFGITACTCWILMSYYVDSVAKALTIALINQFSSAFCNVIGEALVVETSQKQKKTDPEAGAKNVSLFFMIRATGSLLTAFSSGALLEYMDKRNIFLITAFFPLMLVTSAFLLRENVNNTNESGEGNAVILESQYETIPVERETNTNHKSDTSSQITLFCQFLSLDSVYKPVIFIFIFMLTPSYGDTIFFFYTNELKFTPMIMGRLRLCYGLASVIGIYIYNKYLKNVGFKQILWSTTMLLIFFNLASIVLVTRLNLKLGIPDFVFCMAADSFTTALAELNIMPLLVLACNICPKNMEGTLYAFLMSVVNFGSLLANQLGASLTSYLGITNNNFTNLPWLIFIVAVTYILPMPGLALIDESVYSRNNATEEENKILITDDKNNNLKNKFQVNYDKTCIEEEKLCDERK